MSLFQSFFMAGFESSTHRLRDGRRLDLTAATGHDVRAALDYRQLKEHGISTVREAVRWHLVERAPGAYDWSSLLPMLRAARDEGVEAIWDLLHFGWPDHLDIWSSAFVEAFARFARAAATVIADESAKAPIFCPVNEISYMAWAGGDEGCMNPFSQNRGRELKTQLVRASLAAISAVREAVPEARILHAEPAIHVLSNPARPEDADGAAAFRRGQWEALDMITGALAPELGGNPGCVDVVGLNYYPHNQWVLGGGTIPLGHHWYRPLRDLIARAHERYGRPVIISETAAEGTARAAWLHYVAGEVRASMKRGVPVHGICLYPVLDYPGWGDDRLCESGLLGAEVRAARRTVNRALADELDLQAALFASRPEQRERVRQG